MERLTERIGECVQCNDRDCRLSYCDRSCGQYELMVQKLADYEDKEEQGLLHEAKIKDGTPIWYCLEGFDEGLYIGCSHYIYNVTEYEIGEFGKKFWLTEAEAEEALAKMGGKAWQNIIV